MMNGGSDAVQVMYMEVEGIKLAYQVSKDAARLAKQLMTFLIRAMMDAPYRKVSGKTNIKNLKSRSNGQAMVAVTVNKKIYRKLQKDAKSMEFYIMHLSFEIRKKRFGRVDHCRKRLVYAAGIINPGIRTNR